MSRSRIRGTLLALVLVQFAALLIGTHTHRGSGVAGGIIIAAGVVEIVIILGTSGPSVN
jgi:uncharacterized membrane protein YccC